MAKSEKRPQQDNAVTMSTPCDVGVYCSSSVHEKAPGALACSNGAPSGSLDDAASTLVDWLEPAKTTYYCSRDSDCYSLAEINKDAQPCTEETLCSTRIQAVPLVAFYEKAWKVQAATIDVAREYSEAQSVSKFHSSALTRNARVVDFEAPDLLVERSLIPSGLPFALAVSKVWGLLILTPFYSVITSLTHRVHPSVFCLKNLTLQRVLSNPRFRHELVFNADMKLAPPRSMIDQSVAIDTWQALSFEIRDILTSPLARPPVPVIFQFIHGMKELMISVLTSSFTQDVKSILNPLNVVDGDPEECASNFRTMIKFIAKMAQALAGPKGIARVNVKLKCPTQDLNDITQLTGGLRTVVELLNTAKVYQVNARIRTRLVLLQQTVGSIEHLYYRSYTAKGLVHPSFFRNWLSCQPSVSSLLSSHGAAEAAYLTPLAAFDLSTDMQSLLSRLTGGFFSCFVLVGFSGSHHLLFPLDKTRLRALPRRFEDLVTQVLRQTLSRTTGGETNEVVSLLSSCELKRRSVYKLVESRVLLDVVPRVFAQLLALLSGRGDVSSSNCDVRQARAKSVDLRKADFIQEVRTLLLLHWLGASQYYSTPSLAHH